MPQHARLVVAFFVSLLFVALPLRAQDEFPKVHIGGVVDARFISTDSTVSWQDGSLGKLRYGGADGERSELIRISQASLLVQVSLSDVLSAKIQLNADAEPDRFRGHSAVDLIEAYLSYRPVLSPFVRLRMRAGVFFPPVSLENTGPAWTTPYTITTSAINSWIGEEVRPSGGEFGLVLAPHSQEIVISGAAFGNNDPSGSLLAWRGWTLNDRQTGLRDQLPLAPIPGIQDYGVFPRQAPWVQPFREIDGRLGYFANASWTNRWFELRGFRYDNRGVPTDFDGAQYAWYTEFNHFGAEVHLPAGFEIISQVLGGDSKMGPADAVNINFRSAYVLATTVVGRHRFTVRYDTFRIKDHDRFPELDNNKEDGSAWTAAYLIQTGEKHRLGFELLRVESDRPVRASLKLPVHDVELQFQASARIMF